MKKNILTVVIMAATVINLVLTAVLVFSVVPAMNKTTNLIDKVASVIDLEIEDKVEGEDYTIEDLEPYNITYETALKINMVPEEGDDTMHVCLLGGISISFNTKAEDYAAVSEQLKLNSVYAEDVVKKTIGSYKKSEWDQIKAEQECVKKLQQMYDTKCIVEVIFIDPMVA
ncbi:MAG: hypothetical protein J6P16_03440 [Eubacterium sp.]|nr:hypothetical protein [Eubacterium sp.]